MQDTVATLFLRTFCSLDFVCGHTKGLKWGIFSGTHCTLCTHCLLYLNPLYLHICLGCLRRTNICMRFLPIFTSRKVRNSIRISRMTSLLLLWVLCRRRKYKSPNMFDSTSFFSRSFCQSSLFMFNCGGVTKPTRGQHRHQKCWMEGQ